MSAVEAHQRVPGIQSLCWERRKKEAEFEAISAHDYSQKNVTINFYNIQLYRMQLSISLKGRRIMCSIATQKINQVYCHSTSFTTQSITSLI